MDKAAPPLLLDAVEPYEPDARAQRLRGLSAVAAARQGNALTRFGAIATAALLAIVAFDTALPAYWLAGAALVIAGDWAVFRGLAKRCAADAAPMRMPALVAWTAFQSAYGNGLAAILWFTPHDGGRALGAIYLCGGLANAAATLRSSPTLSAAGVTPTVLYLLGLPVAEFLLRGGGMRALTLALGVVLLLVWGVRLWRSLIESDRAHAAAAASAARERQAAQAAVDAKSEMVRRMLDELRTPLAAAAGAREHLRRAAANPQALAQIEALSQAGAVVRLVLDDLAHFDRLQSGRLAISPAPTAPAELARTVVAAFRPAAQDKNLEMFLDITPDLPASVEVDPLRLRQILSNLVSNAVRYTSHGGVRLSVASEPSERMGYVRLRYKVADTGRGLSRAQLAALFARSSADAESNGPELGLAISMRLARLMGAQLSAESELAQGSAFTLAFEAKVLADAARTTAA